MSMKEAALAYARRGPWPVFPQYKKKPIGKEAPHGYYSATTDEDQIRHWWRPGMEWRSIAMPTGEASGIAVLEFDTNKNEWWAKHKLPPTIKARSRRGYHYYFNMPPEGLKSRNGYQYFKRPDDPKCNEYGATEVELKATVGAITLPPSPFVDGTGHYKWIVKGIPIADWDERCQAMLDKWADTAITEELQLLRDTPRGQRNDMLFKVAIRFFELNWRLEHSREDELWDAASNIGLMSEGEKRETARTIKSAKDRAAPDTRNLPEDRQQSPPTPTVRTQSPPAPANGVEPETPRRKRHSEKVRQVFNQLGVNFYRNELTEQVEYQKGDGTLGQLTDMEESAIASHCYDQGLVKIDQVINRIALENSYHPFLDWLNNLPEWDGEDRVVDLCEGCLKTRSRVVKYEDGSPEQEFKVVAVKRFLTGAIRKMREGDQNDVVVLYGPQGIGKSRLVEWLCSLTPTLYLVGMVNPSDKDCQLRLTEKLLWEINELDATTNKADHAALKGFLTTPDVTVRRAYGRRDLKRKARCSFVGTVNKPFLVDDENRRYMIIELESIMWGYEFIELDQLWAQALYYADNDLHQTLTQEEKRMRDLINREYMVDQPMPGLIVRFFDREEGNFMSTADILLHLQKEEVKMAMGKGEEMAIRQAMVQLGVKKGKKGRVNGYFGIAPGTGRGWD